MISGKVHIPFNSVIPYEYGQIYVHVQHIRSFEKIVWHDDFDLASLIVKIPVEKKFVFNGPFPN